MTPRSIPLDGKPRFEVRIVPEAVGEFRDHPEAVQLLKACIDILGEDPHRPRKGRAGLMSGYEPIRKLRPPGLGTLRVYYAIDEEETHVVWLLGVHPRSKDHRPKDLKAALRRLQRRTQS